jgi:8-oxo-dGTP pyrophosphatase MutT (NUDIX family)
MDWYKKLKSSLKPVGPVHIPDEYGIASSVIIPIGWNQKTGQDEILLTKRTEKVNTHKGQVGFPGGVYAAEDKEILRTAFRETFEEVGVKEKDLEVLGMLEPVTTLKDILIFPYVAKMEFPYPFILSYDEVDRLLYLPLEQLIDEGMEEVEVQVGQYKVKSPGTWVEGELIWGASARMLLELRDLLS